MSNCLAKQQYDFIFILFTEILDGTLSDLNSGFQVSCWKQICFCRHLHWIIHTGLPFWKLVLEAEMEKRKRKDCMLQLCWESLKRCQKQIPRIKVDSTLVGVIHNACLPSRTSQSIPAVDPKGQENLGFFFKAQFWN